MLRGFAGLVLSAAAATVQLPANDAILEPSVLNEVERAIGRAPAAKREMSSASRDFARLYETNTASATAKAIALVSSQRADGRWLSGTNDVTQAAVLVLRRISGSDPEQDPKGEKGK